MDKIIGKLCCIFIAIWFFLFLFAGVSTANPGPVDKYRDVRMDMVRRQIKARGIRDEKLLKVMGDIPRHEFIPEKYLTGLTAYNPYGDHPVPIGEGQTISQPYIVALMTDLLELKGKENVLEVGTGSGYQAAVLSNLCSEVYTIEIVKELADWAKQALKEYENVHVKHGDGYLGWEEFAPFHAIIVTCAPDHIPQPLVDQLAEGGRMVIPVGTYPYQELKVVKKEKGKEITKEIIPVSFVPMTGKEIEKRRKGGRSR
ncbi:MAG: protein-L-isoaspartate(D-aspartate) O-methyltransferase [Endomicrobiales bacterium]|nr:protein-L-isoaspartate(D-aspartate) O-methyltransferase [Endomicrobiales bacterium]